MKPLDWKSAVKKVDGPLSTQCWEWLGAVNEKGRPSWGGQRAHRRLYALLKGPPPPVLHHRCENPMCVNPAHMKGYQTHSEHLQRERHTAGRFKSGAKPWNTGQFSPDPLIQKAGNRRRRFISIICQTCEKEALVPAGDKNRIPRFCGTACALVNARAVRAAKRRGD